MKQRIFSHFQDYLIQYISHQYHYFLYCNSSQYILSTYNSQHNNNNNVVLAMTMPYSGQGWRHGELHFGSCTMSSTLTTIYTIILCCPCNMPKYVPRLEGIMHDPKSALCLPTLGHISAYNMDNTILLLLLLWMSLVI